MFLYFLRGIKITHISAIYSRKRARIRQYMIFVHWTCAPDTESPCPRLFYFFLFFSFPRRRSPRARENNKAARHSHMNCAPTGAGYRHHQSTWWSTINMQPPHSSFPHRVRVLHLPLFAWISSPLLPSSLPSGCFFFLVEKARLVSPQRALLQVPDWLLNWHSLKYPSNACRERYVWYKKEETSEDDVGSWIPIGLRRSRCVPAIKIQFYHPSKSGSVRTNI